MAFCTKCGANLSGDAHFCNKCGNKVSIDDYSFAKTLQSKTNNYVLKNNIKIDDFKKTIKFEQQIDNIFREFDDINKPGAAVAIVKNGKILFIKGYGSANLEYNIPITPSTIFHVASVSKQFTVFSILLLEIEGKLNLDDDVRKHIPEVPDFGKVITLRHLATHTSGLRDQWNLLEMAGFRLDDVITKEHILKLVANQKELNFDPGEEFCYCNTGFTLLAEVVARVSGQSFSEFTNSKIFIPLKMNNTLFYDDHEKIVINRAYSYQKDGSEYKKSVLNYANVGATSLFTTAEDLCHWAINFVNPIVGNIDLINQLNTLAKLNNGKTFGVAYGQFIDKYKGLNLIQHTGADAGFRSYLGRFPDQDYSVIVLSNYAASNPTSLAMKVTDIVLKDNIESEDIIEKKSTVEIRTINPIEFEKYIGNYWNDERYFSTKIYLKNGTLRYLRGDDESILAPIGEGAFQMLNVNSDTIVKFENTDTTKKMIVTVNDNGQTVRRVSEFYTPVIYSGEDLIQYIGTYYSEELQTSYNLVMEENKIKAKHIRHSNINFNPIKKDTFSSDKWFFGLIKFERNNENKITGMRVSNNRVRNLYFQHVRGFDIF